MSELLFYLHWRYKKSIQENGFLVILKCCTKDQSYTLRQILISLALLFIIKSPSKVNIISSGQKLDDKQNFSDKFVSQEQREMSTVGMD